MFVGVFLLDKRFILIQSYNYEEYRDNEVRLVVTVLFQNLLICIDFLMYVWRSIGAVVLLSASEVVGSIPSLENVCVMLFKNDFHNKQICNMTENTREKKKITCF